MTAKDRSVADGARLAPSRRMGYAEVVDRIRTDFEETPAMELTLGQAARLWHIGPDDCRFVLDGLVDAGFLHWTARRTITRRQRPAQTSAAHPVGRASRHAIRIA